MPPARVGCSGANVRRDCGIEGVARPRFLCADDVSGVSPMKRPKDKDDRHRNTGSGAEGEIAREKFSALRAFMRSYLHQDFGEEYGSVEEAAKAFCDDATKAEIATVSAEWRTLLAETRGRQAVEINNLLGSKLGSAWNLTGVDELNEITRAFDEWGRGKG